MPLDVLDVSKALIACPSITPEDAGATEVLAKYLSAEGFECHRLRFSESGTADVWNLYAQYGNTGKNLCFAGHTDVVPPGRLEDWTFPPFSPTLHNGMLYGRGTSDMKCAIACFLAAVSEFLQENPKGFNGTISFLITGDEEGPAINGTKKVLDWLQERNIRLDDCIIGEPTSRSQVADGAKIGRRGSINFSIESEGIQGHVACSHLADNAAKRLLNVLHPIINTTLDQGNEYFPPSTIELTSFNVENKAENVVPAHAMAKFNIRYNDSHTGESLAHWVTSACSNQQERLKVNHRISGDAFLNKPGRIRNIIADSIKHLAKRDVRFETTGGISDARFITHVCPVVELGLSNQTAHKIDESVAVEDIYALKDIYKEVITRYFRNG